MPKHISVDDAQDEGVYGTVHDTLDNDAYTLSGQGPETAKREREQLHELRHEQRVASQHDDESDAADASQQQDAASSSKPPPASKTSRTSSRTAGSSEEAPSS